mmetsp:Transcript_856/g.1670  ORF Transcript_856/g.1670 Transcript_856/m.1670 type:complete len:371 (+) Transcript_856:41-1153(+)|eukprot:CAMPEP_0175172518 /NCGR_PEP_ID=MMETSP0087-20121206/31484_1 /TAXON_ID=136419 /ORGANISM="Unknown Unknown, Strain D1" /LENGTH=370 /DNA_ID=CAMNT_0016463611 /DNA_START=39 /DNA_END=1151 /DNA_ORIENTATION=+
MGSSPSQPSMAGSSGNRGTAEEKAPEDTYSVTLKKPLGVTIGSTSRIRGSVIISIDPNGHANEWNNANNDEFDSQRRISNGDGIISIQGLDGRMTNVANMSPLEILSFLSTRSGPVVTIFFKRNKAKIQLVSRTAPFTHELMLQPLHFTVQIDTPIGCELQHSNSVSGEGLAIASLKFGSNADKHNKFHQEDLDDQNTLRPGDLISTIRTSSNVVIDVAGKSISAISDILNNQNGQVHLHLVRSLDPNAFAPRSMGYSVCFRTPSGITFAPHMNGTVVVKLEGEAAARNSKVKSPEIEVRRGDFLTAVGGQKVDVQEGGAPKFSQEDVVEGKPHSEVMERVTLMEKQEEIIHFKFKRTFPNRHESSGNIH